MRTVLVALLLLQACGSGDGGDGGVLGADGGSADGGGGGGGDDGGAEVEPPGELIASSLSRDLAPDVDEATVQAHAASMRGFALDLLDRLDGGGNLFISPYSVSMALAMTWAGAAGDTAAQMAEALHFDLPPEALHPAFNALDLTLAGRPDEVDPATGDPFRLTVVNQLFGRTGVSFEEPFLDILAVDYGAGLRALDFAADPDGERERINDWVEAVTESRITDLLPRGSITTDTALVLVNAIYFQASWYAPFDAADTTEDAFVLGDGSTITVPTMHGVQTTRYGTGDGFAVVDLPYVGESLVMTLLVPDSGAWEKVIAGLDVSALDAALQDMDLRDVSLSVPRFTFRSKVDLATSLNDLGMVDAFDPAGADFSGMTKQVPLYVSGVYHQAFVDVDEAGTEAAAATALAEGSAGGAETVDLVVDRPFLFLIRDKPTGAVLFLGALHDPRG